MTSTSRNVLISDDERRPAPQISFSVTQIRLDSGAAEIDRLDHGADSTLSIDESDGVVIVAVRAGSLTYQSGEQRSTAAEGDVRLISAGHQAISLSAREAVITAVHLPDAGGARRGDDWPGMFLTPRSETASGMVRGTVDYVENVVGTADAAAFELMAEPLIELLRATVRAGFGVSPFTATDSADADYPASLRLALDYIEANATRMVSTADVAAEIFASSRTVQYLFRRHLDTTPTAYLRKVRLSKARQELLSGNRITTSVTATATRWGFGHTGRFAVLYRAAYGESPHQTLAR